MHRGPLFPDFQDWVEEEWWEGVKLTVTSISTCSFGFAISWCLVQDGARVVIGSWQQQNVDCAVAMLNVD